MVPVELRPQHVSVLTIERSDAPQSSEALFGRSTLNVTLRGLRFEASPHAFLQTNINQTEVLYKMIAEAAGERHAHRTVHVPSLRFYLCAKPTTVRISEAHIVIIWGLPIEDVIDVEANCAGVRRITS